MAKFSAEDLVTNFGGRKPTDKDRPKKKTSQEPAKVQEALEDEKLGGGAAKQAAYEPRSDEAPAVKSEQKRRVGKPALKEGEKTVAKSFTLPESLVVKLNAQAAKESLENPGRTVTASAIVRKALERYISEEAR